MELSDYLAELNPDQLKAAQTLQGPVLIQAGAGSGKTKTVIARIHNLIDHGIAPENILAITFTNKAADELRNRLPRNAQGVFASTIHSFCAFILRRLPDLPNYTRNFTIVDSDSSDRILRLVKQDYFDKYKKEHAKHKENEEVIQNDLWDKNISIVDQEMNDSTEISEHIKKRIDSIKNSYILAFIEKKIYDDNHINAYGNHTTTRYKYLKHMHLDIDRDFFNKIADGYNEYLATHDMMDFTHLLYNAVELLKTNPNDLKFLQNQYQYISVDEYQDISDIQDELINLLANTPEHNLCVVGDPNQSIYSFRGAEVTNILEFKNHYPTAKVITIMHNYRSTQNILDVANNVIGHNQRALTINPKLDAINGNGPKPLVVQNYNGYTEADYVIAKIKTLIANGTKPSEIAILYRMNSLSRLFENALVKAGISYKIVGAHNFYDRAEIKDLIAYLSLIANHQNDIAFSRIINCPIRHIGATTIDDMITFGKQCVPQQSLFNLSAYAEYVKTNKNRPLEHSKVETLHQFVKYINQFDLASNGSVCDLLKKINADFYLGYVTKLDDKKSLTDGSRVDNVDQLVSAASEFDLQHPNLTLGDALNLFLQNIQLVSDNNNNDTESVQLMTIHSAKGLEFENVFVVGLEEHIFPTSRTTSKELPEERRLFYVAITRAKKKLYLTYANERTLWGQMQSATRSRFLNEIDIKLLNVFNNNKTFNSKHELYN